MHLTLLTLFCNQSHCLNTFSIQTNHMICTGSDYIMQIIHICGKTAVRFLFLYLISLYPLCVSVYMCVCLSVSVNKREKQRERKRQSNRGLKLIKVNRVNLFSNPCNLTIRLHGINLMYPRPIPPCAHKCLYSQITHSHYFCMRNTT